MIEVRKYYPAANADFRGIPTIEAWPPLTRNTITQLMTCKIEYSEEECTHTADLRCQYVLRLLDFFLPFDVQIDFAVKLWNLICTSYKTRHQKQLSQENAAPSFEHLCEAILNQSVEASDTATFRDAMYTAFLVGTPGTGKSSTPKALLDRLAADILCHIKLPGFFQVLSISVQAPKHGKGRSLAELVFNELVAHARRIKLPFPYGGTSKPRTLPQYESAIKQLIKRLNLGILILDELQHLYSGTGAADLDSTKFLTGFLSKLDIPILMIGTWDAIALLGLESRLGRRALAPATGHFRRMPNDEDSDFSIFTTALLNYQFTKKRVVPDKAMLDRIYFHTQGIHDLIVKLIVLVQLEAIMEGTEEITIELIDAVGTEHMEVLAPALEHMRNGRSESDRGLWDVEPVDFSKYLESFTASLKLRRASRAKPTDKRDMAAIAAKVAQSLHAIAQMSPEEAAQIASESIAEHPSDSAAKHIKRILSESTKKGPRPTRSARKQAEVDARFDELEDSDLRKLVYLASRRGEEMLPSLKSAGHICDVLEDAVY